MHYAVQHVADDSIINMLLTGEKNVKQLVVLEQFRLPNIIRAIDIKTQDEFSALLLAIRKMRIPIVKSLLENGASLHRFPSYRYIDGHLYESCTMLHMAALWYEESQEDEEIVRLLIEYGEDIDATCKCSLTALLIAIQHNKFGLVKILVSLGTDVNKKAHNIQKP